jgi:hypothetical protein
MIQACAVWMANQGETSRETCDKRAEGGRNQFANLIQTCTNQIDIHQSDQISSISVHPDSAH